MEKLTTQQVAELFNVYNQAVYKWHNKKWLVAKFDDKGKRYYNKEEVDYFYKLHRVGYLCKDCGKQKDSTEFKIPKNIIEYGIRCWECFDELEKQWNKNSLTNLSKEKKNSRNKSIAKHRKLYVERNQQFLCKFLEKNPCVDCGESNIIVLELDHLENKVKNVATMVLTGCSIKTIEKEIKKCEVVCANCHRIRTAKRGNHYRYKYGNINVLL